MRVETQEFDSEILSADLENLDTLNPQNLEYLLCRFICEVKKSKNEGDYPGKTLYQIVCALQNYLKKKELNWKLVHGDSFQEFQRVLDSVMQERAALAIGTVPKQVQVISLNIENKLWEDGILGEETPDKLRNTVLYLVGVNCALRAGNEHYALRRLGGCTTSQFSFLPNEMGLKCLVYTEDSVTKTNKGGLKDMQKTRKVVWVKPNSDWRRCSVRIIEKYISLLPKEGMKPNFYLQSSRRPRPFCWYTMMPVGINTLRKVVGTILKDAGLGGFFTNHSLYRTCATRLFQSGADTKLVKEIKGHISDAVHKYQCTSNNQKMKVSEII